MVTTRSAGVRDVSLEMCTARVDNVRYDVYIVFVCEIDEHVIDWLTQSGYMQWRL